MGKKGEVRKALLSCEERERERQRRKGKSEMDIYMKYHVGVIKR